MIDRTKSWSSTLINSTDDVPLLHAVIRGVPYMTAAEKERWVKKCSKFADKQYRFCGQRRKGVKKSQNSVDVIYGSPLTSQQRKSDKLER